MNTTDFYVIAISAGGKNFDNKHPFKYGNAHSGMSTKTSQAERFPKIWASPSMIDSVIAALVRLKNRLVRIGFKERLLIDQKVDA